MQAARGNWSRTRFKRVMAFEFTMKYSKRRVKTVQDWTLFTGVAQRQGEEGVEWDKFAREDVPWLRGVGIRHCALAVISAVYQNLLHSSIC